LKEVELAGMEPALRTDTWSDGAGAGMAKKENLAKIVSDVSALERGYE